MRIQGRPILYSRVPTACVWAERKGFLQTPCCLVLSVWGTMCRGPHSMNAKHLCIRSLLGSKHPHMVALSGATPA